jgi:hypothetical protein
MTDELRLPGAIRAFLRREEIRSVELVRRMGYRNPSRGARRLGDWLEGRAQPVGDQPGRLARALGIELEAVQAMLDHDARALLDAARRRRGRDPRCYLTIRFFAGFYGTRRLPEGLTAEQALALARREARCKGLRCCLDTPDNRQYWLDREGGLERVTEASAPSMSVGGRRFVVLVE